MEILGVVTVMCNTCFFNCTSSKNGTMFSRCRGRSCFHLGSFADGSMFLLDLEDENNTDGDKCEIFIKISRKLLKHRIQKKFASMLLPFSS